MTILTLCRHSSGIIAERVHNSGILHYTDSGLSRRLPLRGAHIVVGRHPLTAQLVIEHISASRRHAEVFFENNSCFLVDVGAMHGTFVNFNRLEPRRPFELSEGDLITFGKCTDAYKFTWDIRGDSGVTQEAPIVESLDHKEAEKTEQPVEEESVKMEVDQAAEEQDLGTVRVSHILVKHTESRNPVISWKNNVILLVISGLLTCILETCCPSQRSCSAETRKHP